MQNWKRTGQGGNADDTGIETENGEKDMKKEKGTISKKEDMDKGEAKGNTAIKS
jgi:hypothetical protein